VLRASDLLRSIKAILNRGGSLEQKLEPSYRSPRTEFSAKPAASPEVYYSRLLMNKHK